MERVRHLPGRWTTLLCGLVAVGLVPALAWLWLVASPRTDAEAAAGAGAARAAARPAAGAGSVGGAAVDAGLRALDGVSPPGTLDRSGLAQDRPGPAPRRVARAAYAVADAAWADLAAPILFQGRVVSELSGEAIEGAEVRLLARVGRALEARTETDVDGVFALRWGADLPADLVVTHADFVDARRPDLVPEGRPEEVAGGPVDSMDPPTFELALTPSARLVGRVLGTAPATEPQDEAAPERAFAWHAGTSSERLWTMLETGLDADGAFSFEDLVPGDYVLTARVPGRAVPLLAGVHVRAGEERRVVLETLPPATLLGRVVLRPAGDGDGGEGVADVGLTLEPLLDGVPGEALAGRSATTVSDGTGAFRFGGLAPGDYRVRATLPWGEHEGQHVRLETSGGTTRIELLCTPPARLAGRLVDAAGEPAGSTKVAVFPASDRARLAQLSGWTFDAGVPTTVTDAHGEFALEGVPTRVALTVAVRDAAASGRVPVALAAPALEPGEACLDLLLELPPAATLAGEVLAPDGRPLAQAKLELYREAGRSGMRLAEGRADERGAFELRGVGPGPAILFAQASGFLSVRLPVEVEAEREQRVEIRLQEARCLAGVALDGEGVGIPGLPIRVALDPAGAVPPEHARRKHRRIAVSDAFGRFAFEDLFDAPWYVDGGSFAWELVDADPAVLLLPDEDWTTLTFQPRARDQRFALRGDVVGANGLAPSGVRIEGLQGGVLELDGGRFLATGLTPTRHRLQVFGDGHRRAIVGPIDPVPGGELDLGRIPLEPAADVTVVVQDDRGDPVASAKVFLVPFSADIGGPADQSRVTLEHSRRGRFRTTQAERARYRLSVRAEGFQRHLQELSLEGRGERTARVTLDRQP